MPITLVLLPGMDGTGLLFRNWIAARPEGYVLQVIDYPADQPLGYDALLPLVRARLPREEPYFLLAESFSGPLGLMLARQAPPNLRGLILCCSFAKNPQPALALARPMVGLLGFSALPSIMARLGHRALFGRFADDETRAALSEALRRLPPAVLQARMRAVLDVDVSDLLPQIRLPVLYLQAREDRVVPASASRRGCDALPQVKLASIVAPHMLLQTMPHEAWAAVEAFLGPRIRGDDGGHDNRASTTTSVIPANAGIHKPR